MKMEWDRTANFKLTILVSHVPQNEYALTELPFCDLRLESVTV